MGAFFIYIFKSAICLAFFYFFFRLLLSRETFHRFNRIALLGVLCLAWLIPCIEVTTGQRVEANQAVLTVEQLFMMAENASATVRVGVVAMEAPTVSWIQIVLLVYLAGILFLACRSIYSLCALINLLFSGKRERIAKGVILIVLEKEVAPFSWMKYIVISRKELEENGREILIHEMAHIRNCHSIDLLIADICILFQWFNPSAWLLKRELQNMHEYEADKAVLNEGVNAKEYQLLLIKKAVGTKLFSMTSSFNHRSLKKRIIMMLKEKSNPWARLKYLYVLPLTAVAVTAFARPEVSSTTERVSAVEVKQLTTMVETKVEEIANKISDPKGGVLQTAPSKQKKTKRMYSKDSLCISKDSCIMLGKTKVAVVESQDKSSVYNPFSESITKVNIKRGINITSNLLPNSNIFLSNDGKDPLILVDGKEVAGKNALSKISPEQVKSFSILKDKSATTVYGDKGKNGVILVALFTKEELEAKKIERKRPKDWVDVKNDSTSFFIR